MSKHRRLAAIMFTDIVGYTALMGKNEAKAMDSVHLSRTVQKSLVREFEGNWLKEMGDGALTTFSSATDAVYCALEIQDQLKEHDLELRIGIHLAEIILENDDVFSDGVNIASRLQAIAEPGGIYLSETVQKAIRGQSDIHTVYLGELRLKNVDYLVKTYALRADGLPPVINGAAKRLTGRIWAEIKTRGMHRVGAAYLCLCCLLLSLIPQLAILKLFWNELFGILGVGFLIAMVMAWKFERGPEGFIRTSSNESWDNPLSYYKRKPLTSNLVILSTILSMIVINAFTLIEEPKAKEIAVAAYPSIAVLPFSNFSKQSEEHHYGDCIQEEILLQLTENKDLDVKSRTSTLSYQHREDKSMKVIGSELGVQYVLEGSVRTSDNRIIVSAQLIEVTSDSHVWSGAFEREVSHNSLTVQRELAHIICLKVRQKIMTLA
jgi:TolB-like protein/class 3 adenylate cyclase